MYKKVLITGGAGFIGSRLSLQLASMGYDVTVLDNLSPQIHGNASPLFDAIHNRVHFFRGDVRHREDWLKALEGQEVVIHLAAETGTGQSMYEIEHYADVNIRGTALMLDVLTNSQHKVRKILLASSRAIYGEGKALCKSCGIVYPHERIEKNLSQGDFNIKCPLCGNNTTPLPTDENSKQHPSSIYGISKLTQEQLMMTAGKALGIVVTILRYQNVYGPWQSLTNPYTGIISIFSTRILSGHDVNVFEDGNETRDFIYIDDVIDATVKSIASHKSDNQIFNVGSGIHTSVLSVALLLKKLLKGTSGIKVSGDYRIGDIRHNVADIEKISKKLFFRPKISLDKGLERFVCWVISQGKPEDMYEKSINEMKQRGMMQTSS